MGISASTGHRVEDAEVTIDGVRWVATVDLTTSKVRIFRDGIWAGDGVWTGVEICDCAADLGDEVYEALDEALDEATSG